MPMAREANVSREDEWFVGERKTLVYTIYYADDKVPADVTDWTTEWRLHKRRDPNPILVRPGVVVDAFRGIVDVEVRPEDYTFGAGTYQTALWRTDGGFEGVLAYGTAVLRSPEETQ